MKIYDYDERTTHVGFADEAYWNEGDFRSIACISARKCDFHEIEQRLCLARCNAGARVAEMKWKSLDGFTDRVDAEAMVRSIVGLAAERKLRIDVVVWNSLDRQPLTQQRNTGEEADLWNLRNMYRSLFKFVMRRWQASEGADSQFWTLAIHQPDGLDRDRLEQHTRRFGIPPRGNTAVDIRRAKSALNYSVQMADLLAGMGAYSHRSWEYFSIWLRQNRGSEHRFPAPKSQYRFPVMYEFMRQCVAKSLGVTIFEQKSGFQGRGFWTRNQNAAHHTINFWPYTMR